MAFANLKNKNVVVVGLGLTGLSCVRFLLAQGAKVSAMDTRHSLAIQLDIPIQLGALDEQRLLASDLVVISPGVSLSEPAIKAALAGGVEVMGDIELFAKFNRVPVLAVTGSNGKSTVASLLALMFEVAQTKALLGGNIGIAALQLLDKEAEFIILELSSFQLETLSSLRPLVACMLNLSDDHLDRHGNLANYHQAKLKIYQGARHIVCNRDDSSTWPAQAKVDIMFGLSGDPCGFSWDQVNQSIMFNNQVFLTSDECLLMGRHNMLNIQAAAAMAILAGLPLQAIKQGATTFGGLAHRCQTVSLYKKIRWINDSKATNVGATVAAISGLEQSRSGKLLLIAGGDGKNADFSPLQLLCTESVDVLITLGKDGARLAKLKAGSHQVSSLQQAVQLAAKLATPHDIVLLSPACASLDMFTNYQQRGEHFVAAIEELAL
ncbi:MAG: UDP-N-acetylmuramoylalanine--D-glutamate ligase [Paraglaciecola sp.]|jgi:UDP-N-acetylmuramoylalanine--D-glutamate ligase